MHKLYTLPPHDTTLYRILSVLPNATEAQITQSYRRLSRQYHPDKQQGCSDQLEQVQRAYEILKKDISRLPYHRYGLMDDSMDVLRLLSGQQSRNIRHNTDELWKLVGYSSQTTNTRSERIETVYHDLNNLLYPLLHHEMDEHWVAHDVATRCDGLKGLPFGAHILRAVGRAYRHSGQKALREYYERNELHVRTTRMRERMREHWRGAQHVLAAAFARGRASWKERKVERMKKNDGLKQEKPVIAYFNDDSDDPFSVSDNDEDLISDDFLDLQVAQDTEDAILQSLQLEALWKVCKIDLDRIIRTACDRILYNDTGVGDGWVTATDQARPYWVRRVRAASALVMVGDIMVQRSKEGTAWIN